MIYLYVGFSFKLDEVFDNFSDFSAKLTEYEVKNSTLFVVTDSLKNLNLSTMRNFPYQYIVYSCKQGSIRASESEGIRPNQRHVNSFTCAFLIYSGIRRLLFLNEVSKSLKTCPKN